MKEATSILHRERVRRVLGHMREHLALGMGLRELAELACLAPHHFHRVFKRLTGRGVGEHFRKLRLVRAAVNLRCGRRSITELAFDAGYKNVESFTRAFAREFGQTPSRYRARKESTMSEVKIGLVKIPVTNFGRAAKFYRETLGLAEEFAVEAYGWAQYKTGDVPLCLYVVGMGGGDGKPGGETGIHLSVADAKAYHAAVSKRETRAAGKLETSDDGGMFFMVTDPDGNKLKVAQQV